MKDKLGWNRRSTPKPEIYLVKTPGGTIEMPADVIGERPWEIAPAFWTRMVELCTDWTKGLPRKSPTDLLVPSGAFRNMRSRVEEFLHSVKKEGACLELNDLIIDKLNRVNWARMEKQGLVTSKEQAKLVRSIDGNWEWVLVQMRKMLEQFVDEIIKSKAPGANGDLFLKIKKIKEKQLAPKVIINIMHTIRAAGNTGAHELTNINDPTGYVNGNVMFFIQLAEWFSKNYLGNK